MIKRALCTVFVVVGLLGFASVAGAQGPRGQEGFGPGGGRGSAKCAPSCPQYQFTYTRTSIQPVLLPTGASTVTHKSTGTIAGDVYGSTYRDGTLDAVGPWASSQSGPQQFIDVRDLDPGVMMSYFVNVTKGTYEQFAIKLRTPRGNGTPNPNGKGPDGKGPWTPPVPTKLSYSLADGSYTCAEAEKITMTHGADSTTNRVFCPALRVVLEEDRTDPRFGSTTYVLSAYTGLTKFPFTPTGKLVEHGPFGHGGGPGGDGQRRTPPPPQD